MFISTCIYTQTCHTPLVRCTVYMSCMHIDTVSINMVSHQNTYNYDLSEQNGEQLSISLNRLQPEMKVLLKLKVLKSKWSSHKIIN